MALIVNRTFIAAEGKLSGSVDDYPDGIILVIDKPYRWTSADVVRKLKFAACKHFGRKNLKVGHAGTLDPLATGILLLCIGKATRMAEELQKHEKEYIAAVVFGATTPSYDLEKEVDNFFPHDHIDEDLVRATLPSFLGPSEQVAPLFSAKSADGVRAYELARKMYRQGGDFDHSLSETLNKQKIEISEIELLSFHPHGIPPLESGFTQKAEDHRSSRINVADSFSFHLPTAVIRVRCSKGTYIRALARDLGEALCSGAHLGSLRRSQNGSFKVEVALGVEEALKIFQH